MLTGVVHGNISPQMLSLALLCRQIQLQMVNNIGWCIAAALSSFTPILFIYVLNFI